MTYLVDCAWTKKLTTVTSIDHYVYVGACGDLKNCMVATTSGSYYGTNYLTMDYGQTWTKSTLFPASPRIVVYDALCTNEDASLIICSSQDYANQFSPLNNMVFKSTDYGVSWSQIPFFWTGGGNVIARRIVMSDSGQYVYAKDSIGGPGKVYVSQDYGASWTTVPLAISWPSSVSNNIFCSADGRVAVFLAYYRSSLYPRQLATTSDYGSNWTVVDYDLDNQELADCTINYDGSIIYALVYNYTTVDKKYIYKSVDYGASWTKVITPEPLTGSIYGTLISTNGTGEQIRITYSQYNYMFSRDYGSNWYSARIKKATSYYFRELVSQRTLTGTGPYEAIAFIGPNNYFDEVYYGTNGFMIPYGGTRVVIGD